MIYAIARFDWLGMECTASLGPDGWKVPCSLGVEAALNVVARLSTDGLIPGSAVDHALDSVSRIFPNAVIERAPQPDHRVNSAPYAVTLSVPAHAIA